MHAAITTTTTTTRRRRRRRRTRTAWHIALACRQSFYQPPHPPPLYHGNPTLGKTAHATVAIAVSQARQRQWAPRAAGPRRGGRKLKLQWWRRREGLKSRAGASRPGALYSPDGTMRKRVAAMWRVALEVACRRIFGSELRPFFSSALSRMIPTPGPLSGLPVQGAPAFPVASRMVHAASHQARVVGPQL